MYRTREKILIAFYRMLDIAVVAGSFVVAFYIRSRVSFYPLEPFEETLQGYTWHLLAVLFIWWQLLYFNKVYVSYRGKSVLMTVWAVVKANTLGLLVLGALMFFLKEYWIHRTLILIFYVVSTLLLSLEKVVLFAVLGKLRKSDKNLKHTLIVGMGKEAGELIRLIRANPETGFHVNGLLGNDSKDIGKEREGVPVIGASRDLLKILHQFVVDEVFITLSLRRIDDIRQVLIDCELYGINARIMPKIHKPEKAKVFMDELMGTSFITFTTRPIKTYQMYLKNFIDFAASLCVSIIMIPVFALIAAAIKLDSKGPVFYRQTRAGMNGRKFVMYKFRSMAEGSDARIEELQGQSDLKGLAFKMKNDPRVTRVGRVLRKTSMDEFPQFFNVFRGDMSIVGPRPLPVYESDLISGVARRRLSMKPGITGLWQVSGRSEVDFDNWMRLDLQYIDSWSLWLDVSILLKTLVVWFSGRGAY